MSSNSDIRIIRTTARLFSPMVWPTLWILLTAVALWLNLPLTAAVICVTGLIWYTVTWIPIYRAVRWRDGETLDEWQSRLVAASKRDPLFCRLGMHQWYSDSAWFTSADRCGRCGTYKDPYAGEKLDRERGLWENVPKSGDTFGDIAWVGARLNGSFPPTKEDT